MVVRVPLGYDGEGEVQVYGELDHTLTQVLSAGEDLVRFPSLS